MSTWSEIIEKLVFTMDDCKKALAEKDLIVTGQVNLCNVDECINKVLDADRYSVSSTLKHSLNDYSSLIPNDLSNVRLALQNKDVSSSADLKISQIPDKIREIEITTERYAGNIDDFRSLCSSLNPKNIYFTDEKPPSNVTTYDWSKNKDKSVVIYMESDNMYITTKRKGVKVILPSSLANMFNDTRLHKLELVDFSMADFSLVTDMTQLFRGCNHLKNVNMDNIDVSNVTVMSFAFCDCYYLESLDLSTWDTKNLEDCMYMFDGCMNLTDLKLNFNTKNLKNAESMFLDCSSLTTLDLRSFDLSNMSELAPKTSGIGAMFLRCSSLRTIIANNWANNSFIVSEQHVFDGCTSLPGYSDRKTSGAYCKPTSQGGYFTSP